MKKVKRMNKLIALIIYILSFFLYSCSHSPNTVYLDLNKQAIISCSGDVIKKIRIETTDNYIIFEGFSKEASIIYLNKPNPAFRITIEGKDNINYNYTFKLSPKFIYTAMSYNGLDRGPFRLTFTTDSLGSVIAASRLNCN